LDLDLLLVIGTVAVAGLVRGITGFGGAMVMTPALSVLIGPTRAVVVALVLETSAAIQLLPDALRKAQWKSVDVPSRPCARSPVNIRPFR
jgi:uncharacterized protein